MLTPEGTVTEVSFAQSSNALAPIEVTLVPLKVTVASFEQPEKQVAGIAVTAALTVTAVIDVQPLNEP